jgi:hypothetical protein
MNKTKGTQTRGPLLSFITVRIAKYFLSAVFGRLKSQTPPRIPDPAVQVYANKVMSNGMFFLSHSLHPGYQSLYGSYGDGDCDISYSNGHHLNGNHGHGHGYGYDRQISRNGHYSGGYRKGNGNHGHGHGYGRQISRSGHYSEGYQG